MKKNKDDIVLICSTIDVAHETVGIWAYCLNKGCGAVVWLSDTSIQSLKKMNPKRDYEKKPPILICMDCLMKSNKDITKLTFLPPTDIQIKEIMEVLNRTKAK